MLVFIQLRPLSHNDVTSDGYVNEFNLTITNNCSQIFICLLFYKST